MYLAQGSREEKEEFREGLKREIGEVARRWGVTAGKVRLLFLIRNGGGLGR